MRYCHVYQYVRSECPRVGCQIYSVYKCVNLAGEIIYGCTACRNRWVESAAISRFEYLYSYGELYFEPLELIL